MVVGALDLFFAGVVLFAMLMGGIRGFVKQVFSWLCWISCAYILYYYMYSIANLPVLHSIVGDNELLRVFVVFSSVIFIAFCVSSLSQFLLKRILEQMGMSGVDKFFGVYFGFMQGFAVVVIVVLGFNSTAINQESWWKKSSVVTATKIYAPIYGEGLVAALHNGSDVLDSILLPLMKFHEPDVN